MGKFQFDSRLVRECNNLSSAHAGDVIVQEAERTLDMFRDKFASYPCVTREQHDYIEQRAAEWEQLVQQAFTDRLERRASYVPLTVAGGSNYPAKQMNRRADRALSAATEWDVKMVSFLENTLKKLNKMRPLDYVLGDIRRNGLPFGYKVSDDDPYAIEKLEAKLEHHQRKQRHMKRVNEHYRRHGTTKGCVCVDDSQAYHFDQSIMLGYHKVPFPSYELSSNNAIIKTTEKRIAKLRAIRDKEKQEATDETT